MKEWKIEEDLEENIQSGKFRIPAFIKLVFRWDEEDLERTITLAVERLSPNGLEEDPSLKISNRKKRGSILIFVLVLIVLLSVISTRLMQETIQEMRYVSQQHFRDNFKDSCIFPPRFNRWSTQRVFHDRKTLYSPDQLGEPY